MATTGSADRPKAGKAQMHLGTKAGSLAPHCLLVGSPKRANWIARRILVRVTDLKNDRGLDCYTGFYNDVPMSVVTTGMGGGSTGIVLPEAVRSGARRFIRVGSCSALQRDAWVGDAIIATGAVRLDGTSNSYAPIEYPAVADYRVVMELELAAKALPWRYSVGIGATCADFNEGQARPDDSGYVPPRLKALHDELSRRGVVCYDMEDSTIFTWCTTHGGLWAGSVKAAFGNRANNKLKLGAGESQAITIGLSALHALATKYPL